MENFKFCTGCCKELPADKFYLRNGKPKGNLCKEHVQARNRESWVNGYKERAEETRKEYRENNAEEIRKYQRSYYNSMKGRAKSMMKTIRQRMKKWGVFELLDFDESYLIQLMEVGVCSITGEKFTYETQDRFKCNPFSPSIDRIESTGYYTRNNVRMVIWQFNLMKGELTDKEVFDLCERIVKCRNR